MTSGRVDSGKGLVCGAEHAVRSDAIPVNNIAGKLFLERLPNSDMFDLNVVYTSSGTSVKLISGRPHEIINFMLGYFGCRIACSIESAPTPAEADESYDPDSDENV